MLIKIFPITQRAKNRVREHGEVMRLTHIDNDPVLVESVGKTWRGEKWLGWFSKADITFQSVDND